MIVQFFCHHFDIDDKLFDFVNNNIVRCDSRILCNFVEKKRTITEFEIVFENTQCANTCDEIVDIINAS